VEAGTKTRIEKCRYRLAGTREKWYYSKGGWREVVSGVGIQGWVEGGETKYRTGMLMPEDRLCLSSQDS
jgi:hypothetical protein